MNKDLLGKSPNHQPLHFTAELSLKYCCGKIVRSLCYHPHWFPMIGRSIESNRPRSVRLLLQLQGKEGRWSTFCPNWFNFRSSRFHFICSFFFSNRTSAPTESEHLPNTARQFDTSIRSETIRIISSLNEIWKAEQPKGQFIIEYSDIQLKFNFDLYILGTYILGEI